MFKQLGLIEKFEIPKEKLWRFISAVICGYRDVPYHNWRHAFSVTHFFYSIARSVDLEKYFESFEILAFLISCLCHDIDHRGRNNGFVLFTFNFSFLQIEIGLINK